MKNWRGHPICGRRYPTVGWYDDLTVMKVCKRKVAVEGEYCKDHRSPPQMPERFLMWPGEQAQP